jgi:tRNA(fMet)-specific endonuclease VapC
VPACVVDTDVVSYLFRGDTRGDLYRPHLIGNTLVVSFMTVAELDRWALERKWGARRIAQLEAHLQQFVIYPFNRDLCKVWAGVFVSSQAKGRPVGVADAWIAATAIFYGIPLVTHNRRHYEHIDGLTVISEA